MSIQQEDFSDTIFRVYLVSSASNAGLNLSVEDSAALLEAAFNSNNQISINFGDDFGLARWRAVTGMAQLGLAGVSKVGKAGAADATQAGRLGKHASSGPPSPRSPIVPTQKTTSFVRVGGDYRGGFEELVRRVSGGEDARLGVIRDLGDVKLPATKRALVVWQDAPVDSRTVGALVWQKVGNETILFQVVGVSGDSVAMVAQRLDDVLDGTFPPNLAHVQGQPWKGKRELGRGGLGSVYEVDGFAVKIAFSADPRELGASGIDRNLLELRKTLAMQDVEGIIKVKGMYQVDTGELAIVYEKLAPTNFAEMSTDEFTRVSRDLAATVLELQSRNLPHTDISPGNIMMRGNKPVLIDVGTGGSTLGYSSVDNDGRALARSLIDQRAEATIKADLVEQHTAVTQELTGLAKRTQSQVLVGEELDDDTLEILDDDLIEGFISTTSSLHFRPRIFSQDGELSSSFQHWSAGKIGEGANTIGLQSKLQHYRKLNELSPEEFKTKLRRGDYDQALKSAGIERSTLVRLIDQPVPTKPKAKKKWPKTKVKNQTEARMHVAQALMIHELKLGPSLQRSLELLYYKKLISKYPELSELIKLETDPSTLEAMARAHAR